MSGPCGGNAGAIPRGGKGHGKGGFPSKRKMPLKGLRKGGYILVSYREKKAPGQLDEKVDYEGKIIDKRVGWDNRESYVELEDCIRLNAEGEIVAKEGNKRLFDAFIEDCEEVEKTERPLCAELMRAAVGAGRKAGGTAGATDSDGGAGCGGAHMGMGMGCMGMGMGMEAMMPAMMAAAHGGACGMMPSMGMGGMPMGMMPMMGMGGMHMGMPMGMMGMPMMGMMPMGGMQQMGMMGMPMMGMSNGAMTQSLGQAMGMPIATAAAGMADHGAAAAGSGPAGGMASGMGGCMAPSMGGCMSPGMGGCMAPGMGGCMASSMGAGMMSRVPGMASGADAALGGAPPPPPGPMPMSATVAPPPPAGAMPGLPMQAAAASRRHKSRSRSRGG